MDVIHLVDRIYKIMKGTFHTVTGIPNHGKSYFLDMILIKLAKTQNNPCYLPICVLDLHPAIST